MRAKAYLAVLPSIIKRDVERLSFRVYVTDTLQTIAENTAIPAAVFTDSKSGKAMARRWIEPDKPVPQKETRTADKIIDHIKKKIAGL